MVGFRDGPARRWTWSSSLRRRIRLKECTMMDPKTVEILEEKIEGAVAEVIVKMGRRSCRCFLHDTLSRRWRRLRSPSTRLPWRTSDERNEHETIGHHDG